MSNKSDVVLNYQWSFESKAKEKPSDDQAVKTLRRYSTERELLAGRPLTQQTGRPRTTTTVLGDTSQKPKAPLPVRPSTASGRGRAPSALGMAYDAASVVTEEGTDVFPFSIVPEVGSILAGKKATFTVRFCPLNVGEHEAFLRCRYV